MKGFLLASVAGCAAAAPVPDVAPHTSGAGIAQAGTPATAAAVPQPARPPADLFVRCDDPASCPEAVGMVVFAGEAEAERCTGTLVGADLVITASHCVTAAQRRAGASCRGAWMAFPPRAGAPGEWVQCREVTRIFGSVSQDALRQEYALLRLERALPREPLQLLGAPLEPGSIVTVVSVTPHPVYNTSHALGTRLCRAIGSEPAVHALGPNAAHVGWLSHCPMRAGNSGSPVLDGEGRVRAIVHGGTWSGFGLGVTSQVAGSGGAAL